VRSSHSVGLAFVSSDRSNFLSRVLASGKIAGGAADVPIQLKPGKAVEFFEALAGAGAGAGAEASKADASVSAVPDPLFYSVQWAPRSIGAPAAWEAGYTGKGVRVAVIDGGVDDTNIELAGRIDAAKARSFVTGETGSCEAQWNCDADTFWHGTHVTGIIAANGIGIIGIAYEATIVPVKALHNNAGSFESIISAIMYAAGEGQAHIINMSLGGVLARNQPGAGELVASLNKAVNFAGSRGVLVISAAGNDAIDFDHSATLMYAPAESGNGLAVSATGPAGFGYTDETDFTRFASYSNYGNSLVGVAGPGGDYSLNASLDICTKTIANDQPVSLPCYVFDMVLSTNKGTFSYFLDWGTSMAAPAVAAVAALIKQKYPNISVGALKARLLRAATDEGKVGNDPYYGKGYINAALAIAD
jgi:subtilisin family serine protease